MRNGWVVRVPASSANVGRRVRRRRDRARGAPRGERHGDDPAPETHPAVRAFPLRREASGRSACARSSPAAAASGSRARRASPGLLAAHAQHGRPLRDVRPAVLQAATELEGHADNVAASLFGGVVAVAGGRAVRVPLGRELAVVVWVPADETPTASARRLLPEQVRFDDAVVQRRPHRAARRRARGRRRRRAAGRDRGPPAPGPAPGPRPRHPRRDRRRARARVRTRRGCRVGSVGGGVRRPGAAADQVAAALPADGRALVLDDRRRGSHGHVEVRA